MSSPRRLLRARAIYPVTGPALENGAVLVDSGRIAAIGSFPDLHCQSDGMETVDLGDVVLAPGLVNAHCHLDYSDMTGLPAPRHFSDWIKSLLALKAAAGYTEYAAAWLRGAQMLLRNGVTTVGDIEAVPELLPDVWSGTPLRVLSFLEMTGVKSRRDPAEIVGEAAAKIETFGAGRSWGGLSPHALYSTSPALLECAGRTAKSRGWTLTMHLAESDEEAEMYESGSGPLHEWLRGQRDMSDCGGRTCTQQTERCGLLGENFLAVHGNYLSREDAALLGRSGASVAHCPRSHAYFGHAPFPYEDLKAGGVNVCLGTDSLASAQKVSGAPLELSLFSEMRLFAARHPGTAPKDILRMATVNGARALGRAGKLGELTEGALADIIAVPLTGDAENIADGIVHHSGPVAAVMIDGVWALPPKT